MCLYGLKISLLFESLLQLPFYDHYYHFYYIILFIIFNIILSNKLNGISNNSIKVFSLYSFSILGRHYVS